MRFSSFFRVFWALLVIAIISFSCTTKRDETETALSSAHQNELLDSLKKLDSLVLQIRVSDKSKALRFAYKARSLADLTAVPEAMIRSYNTIGNAYSLSNMDSAFFYYSKAINFLDSTGLLVLRHRITYNIAMLHLAAGDYKTSLSLLDETLRFSIEHGDHEMAANSYNSIGNIYINLNDSVNAKKMYDSSFSFAKRFGLFLEMGVALGNLAKFETNNDNVILKLRRAIYFAQKNAGSHEQVALLLTNLANKLNNVDSSLFYNLLALKNVSIETAPDAALAIYNNLAYCYLDKGDLVNAKRCVTQFAIPLARKFNNYDWLSTVLDTYADILSTEGLTNDALRSEKEALEAMRLSNVQTASDQVRLLAAILDVSQKEDLIMQSKVRIEKGLLILEARNRLLIILALFTLLLVVFFLVALQRKRIQIQKQQLLSARMIIKAEEDERAKFSRDFHDLLGHKFTAFSNMIESSDGLNKSIKRSLSESLAGIRESVRELSHRMSPSWLSYYPLEKNIQGLCADYESSGLLSIVFTCKQSIPDLTEEVRLHTFRIVQELLTNSLKYAPRSVVRIDLITMDSMLKLTFTDNGPGFDTSFGTSQGMGLKNIQERMLLLKGRLTIESGIGSGVRFECFIPMKTR